MCAHQNFCQITVGSLPKECHYYQGPMLPMPSSLSNDDETSASDLNVLPGSKRKLREGFETSGLAKKLVF